MVKYPYRKKIHDNCHVETLEFKYFVRMFPSVEIYDLTFKTYKMIARQLKCSIQNLFQFFEKYRTEVLKYRLYIFVF